MPIYMKIDGIDGPVTAAGHEKWFDCNSFQFGVGRGIQSPTGRSANRETSAPSVSEIVVTKMLDDSTAKLFQDAAWGEGKKVQIHFAKTDKDKFVNYLEYELENTLISGYSISSGGEGPTESLSLNFTKITMSYTGSDVKGKAKGANRAFYDLALGKGG